MDIFKLYRNFWDYSFSNPEMIKPTHVAIFSFSIEHCNRLGWKTKFGFPTSMVMEATGIKSYSVYKKHFDDLVEFGFIEVIEYSKNQYSSNIIALKENYKAIDKAINKALDKALITHTTKQGKSKEQSNSSIDKPITNNQITNNNTLTSDAEKIDFQKLQDYWNGKCKNTLVPEIKVFTKTRQNKIKTLVAEYGKDEIIKAINKLFESDFCTGKKTNWIANFDFFCQQSSFVKLIEGSYSNNNQTQQIKFVPNSKKQTSLGAIAEIANEDWSDFKLTRENRDLWNK